jgi:N-acyl-D-amino-acid deacylase
MAEYDIVLRSGTIVDGNGGEPFVGDIAIQGDTIAAIGSAGTLSGNTMIDVNGLYVAPGFINMLSWSVESLIKDGHSQSEIRQGVTLEIMGEGESMGPLSEKMKKDWLGGILGNSDIQYDIEWTTLGEYLQYLEKRGVSTNVASYVGSGTLRIYAVGYDDREPTADELNLMKSLVRQAMEEGAVGMSAALIYPPASYAKTEELIELVKVVAEYDGVYVSHLRSEGSAFYEALDEFLRIVRETGVRGEIYHLKAAGKTNWDKMDEVIRRIDKARADGLSIHADMYTYPFSGTGLSSCIPNWAHDGGHEAMIARLKNPDMRVRIREEMREQTDRWENMYYENGMDGILLSGFSKPHMKALTGKTLREVCDMRGTPPEDTIMDLIIEDDSRIFTMYFSMSEDNLRKQVTVPWVSFCSDAESQAPEGVFLNNNPHPRAYGSFARVLGKYVRDEGLLTVQEAVHKLAALPADVLKIQKRGRLAVGNFADVVVFDLANVQDYATPQKPHQYSTGMVHVFVNGGHVLKDGEHTGAKPGRFVKGPGYKN